MNKNWKKRLSIFLKDSDTYTTLPIASFGIGAFASIFTNIIFAGFLNASFLSTTLWTFGVTTFGLIGLCIGEALFAENDSYDKRIKEEEAIKVKQEQQRKQEEERRIEKEEREKQRKRLEAINALSETIPTLSYREEERELVTALHTMIQTIRHIMDTYTLTVEEEHYLFRKLPMYMKEIILSYEKLVEENKKVQREEFLRLLQAKQTELETLFVNRHQENILMEMNKNMKMLDEKVYQNVYDYQ